MTIDERRATNHEPPTTNHERRVERDVTEGMRLREALRASEEQYRKLFEGALDGIAFADAETGIVLDCNDALLKMVERERDEVIGKPQKNLHPADDVVGDVSRTFEEHRTSRLGQVITTKVITKTGKLKDVEIKANFNEIGNRKVLQGVFRDISERVRSENEKEEIRSQLCQSQKMETLGTLMAGVAHEINNPINMILFNAPLVRKIWNEILPVLQDRATSEPNRKYGGLTIDSLETDLDRLLEDMEMAGNRVAAIVKSLNDYSRKSDVVEKKPMHLNEAVENAVRMAQSTLRKAGVQLEVDLSAELPPMHGNMQSVEQVVLNIVLNGVQAIKNDHGVVKVRTGYDARRGDLSLEISDNGQGIDPSFSGRIFDPFFTTRQAEGGTGLGLAVTYSLVQAHKGEITFESEPGKGTVFRVFFPAQSRSAKIKVMAVDDDEFALDTIKRAFDKVAGYETETALSGTEALIKLGTRPPDVLLLDLSMPGMDGVEVCRVLKKDRRLSKIKVIIITGFPHDPRLEKLKKMGYEQIYVKPLSVMELVGQVGKIGDRESGIGDRESGIEARGQGIGAIMP